MNNKCNIPGAFLAINIFPLLLSSLIDLSHLLAIFLIRPADSAPRCFVHSSSRKNGMDSIWPFAICSEFCDRSFVETIDWPDERYLNEAWVRRRLRNGNLKIKRCGLAINSNVFLTMFRIELIPIIIRCSNNN